ncbi:3'-5' exonuclease [Actinomadura rupiterrae]|uniref:3'-5' exonuclease n=1 Tax=Actinomadura rupiterrae TaxID=559627 RepID=UPI0020A51652|nr:3'-5' exonuclease [Actinomadura rupiterrae]MCP2342970.1 DNA polymerase-3 subunit epsilon/exodeoxyribonuclease X [Actinomadura rupiterrae]
MRTTSWKRAPLVALDLEGTGAQDRDQEAILEIALVPMHDGQPRPDRAFHTLINPERHVPSRPWISPGLTNAALAQAPTFEQIAPQLTNRINGAVLVGHNIGVDWRLLRRHLPDLQPAGLLDTLRLERHLHGTGKGQSLTNLLDRYQLTERVTVLVPDGRPHRALWDTIGAALLLAALIAELPGPDPTLQRLQHIAAPGLDGEHARANSHNPGEQTSLMDL